MIEYVMWFVTAASLAGVVLNIYKLRSCFYIWAVTNAAWCVYDIYKVAYPQAALMGIYFALAVWGAFKWRTDK